MKKCLVIFAMFAFITSGFAADFKATDKNDDGKVSEEEFAGEDEKLKKKFKKLDKDADGSLTEKEFAASMKKKKKEKKEKK